MEAEAQFDVTVCSSPTCHQSINPIDVPSRLQAQKSRRMCVQITREHHLKSPTVSKLISLKKKESWMTMWRTETFRIKQWSILHPVGGKKRKKKHPDCIEPGNWFSSFFFPSASVIPFVFPHSLSCNNHLQRNYWCSTGEHQLFSPPPSATETS